MKQNQNWCYPFKIDTWVKFRRYWLFIWKWLELEMGFWDRQRGLIMIVLSYFGNPFLHDDYKSFMKMFILKAEWWSEYVFLWGPCLFMEMVMKIRLQGNKLIVIVMKDIEKYCLQQDFCFTLFLTFSSFFVCFGWKL